MKDSLVETSKTPTASKVGIYCLANDDALEWFESLIRSIRKHNPIISVTVIPYNRDIAKIISLQKKYGFTVMHEEVAGKFDNIANQVAGRGISGGTFRKFACFLGEFEQFLFLDSDIVVTMDINGLFETFLSSQYDLVYFDHDMQVFAPEFARKMMQEYGQYGFNSGAFFARKGVLEEKTIKEAASKGEQIRNHFGCWGEQPFLNYVCQIFRLRMAHVNKLNPALSFKPKAWTPFYYDSKIEKYLDPEMGILPLVHWAGDEWPTMVRPEAFLKYRTLGMECREKRRYTRNFYYRRFRAGLKERMKQSALFAQWVKNRDERLRRQRLNTVLKPE